MDTMMLLGLLAFALGLILFALAFARKSPIKNQAVTGGIAAVLFFGGLLWGVMPYYEENFATESGGGTTIVNVDTGGSDECPAFDIDPTALTSATNMVGTSDGAIATTAWNAAETVLTIPVTVSNTNSGVHAAFGANETGTNFSITPIPPVGANADDLATIYFETEYDMTHEGKDVLKDNGNGIYEANFSVGNDDATGFTRWHHSGSDTMLLTNTLNLQLVYGLDGGGEFAEVFQTVGETTTWTVTFHNADWTWSKVYTISAICIVSNA